MKLTLLLCFLYLALADYDQSLSKLTASYSAITHCNSGAIEGWSCKLCQTVEALNQVHYINNKEFHNVGLIGYNSAKNSIVVAWRGTIDARNWAQDFSFDRINYSKWFHFAYKAIEKQLISRINTLFESHPNASIIVTGHSLGGAIATISALQLQLKYNKVSALYAFGCPRIGNNHLSQFINLKIKQTYRPVHNRDLYVHLPYEAMGFHHYGRQVLYNQNFTEFKVCNEGGQDRTCSDKFFPNYSEPDHDLYFVRMDTSVC